MSEKPNLTNEFMDLEFIESEVLSYRIGKHSWIWLFYGFVVISTFRVHGLRFKSLVSLPLSPILLHVALLNFLIFFLNRRFCLHFFSFLPRQRWMFVQVLILKV